MANFNPPFSNAADRRFPTSDERQNGFDCGPADRELFNGLFHRIESEIGNVISEAGITPSDSTLTQLRDSIQAMIDASTGGGDPEQFLLLDQARARLPIYPDVLTSDGRITIITAGTGTIRLPGGVSFQHRGIFPITTEQTDFPTLASKIYHLRWNPTDGFELKDLADSGYNPGTLVETDVAFDAGYDDMLVARIVTNSSNIATITNLANRPTLRFSYFRDYLLYPAGSLGNPSVGAAAREIINFNFARTPQFYMNGLAESGLTTHDGDGAETNLNPLSLTRYNSEIFAFSYNRNTGQGGRPRYNASFLAMG